MKATINNIQIDLSKPIDISIPLTNNEQNPIAWYQNAPEIEPVTMGDWIGKVSEGKSSTNFNNIFFNPHAHGTHTECLGHITREFYSINQCLNTNPPYLDATASVFIREKGIQHLLIDLPSVDREHDEGKLLAHKAFWNVKDVNQVNDDARFNCTITEMIYVDEKVKDGSFILNLQFASFENDASPSKPILFKIEEI